MLHSRRGNDCRVAIFGANSSLSSLFLRNKSSTVVGNVRVRVGGGQLVTEGSIAISGAFTQGTEPPLSCRTAVRRGVRVEAAGYTEISEIYAKLSETKKKNYAPSQSLRRRRFWRTVVVAVQ